MKIMLVAAVEDMVNVMKQVEMQTVKHRYEFVYVDQNPEKGITERRKRIAENQKLLQETVAKYDVDLVWQLEGDVILKPDTLERLIASLEQTDAAYVSAAQIGRHGVYMIGAWHVYEETFESVDYRKTGRQLVDATGLYCLLAHKDAWLQGEATWQGEPWGPDVNFGLSLRKKGYNIVVDLDIPIGHKTKRGEIWPHHATTCNVHFYKEDGRWKYRTS